MEEGRLFGVALKSMRDVCGRQSACCLAETSSSMIVSPRLDIPTTCKMSARDGPSLRISTAATLKETEVVNLTCCLTQSKYIDTGQTNPSASPIRPHKVKAFGRVACSANLCHSV